jgi:hypothetical protein
MVVDNDNVDIAGTKDDFDDDFTDTNLFQQKNWCILSDNRSCMGSYGFWF